MVTKLETLISWLSLPIYAWQGTKIRKTTMRLQPPSGNPYLSAPGKGKPIRVLVIGDSSAAGVGVDKLEDSLGGQLVKYLNEMSGRPVEVRVSGNNSATAGQLRDFIVPNLRHEEYDYISLNIGTNDAKNFHKGNRFCKEFGGLLYALKAKFPGAVIIWGGLIDVSKMPALPSPLNKLMNIRVRIIRRNGKTLCQERGALAPDSRWQPIPENFARDGFHSSALGYARWAEELAEFLLALEGKAK